MITETLKRKLQEQKSRIGLVGSSLTVKEYDEAEYNVKAFIKPHGWDITLQVKKGFEPIQDKRQQAYARKKGIKDGLEVLLTDILDHECGHWELPHGSGYGCPYDVYNHDLILEAIKAGLPKDKKGQAGYVANAFEDVIDNARCKEFRGDFSGQVLFWDHEGIRTEQERGEKGFTPFYEAFVQLNMHLWGDGADKALLKRHYTKDARVSDAVKKCIDEMQLPEKIGTTASLFDKSRWPQMAETFARNLANLLDEQPSERLSAFSPEEGGGEGQEQEESGNGIEQRAYTREGKEDIAYGRYSEGQKLSPNIDRHEQLDTIYTRLARRIPVKVHALTRQDAIRVGSLTLRGFDPERDDPQRVRLNKLIAEEGGLTLGYEKSPLVVDAKEKVQRASFPNFKMVVLDNSSSMKDAPDGSKNVGRKDSIPWGDNSKYHYAVLGFYGIENFLRDQGIAPFIKHGAALFSSGTRYEEAGFDDIARVRRHILSPDWGNTNVDAAALKGALEGRESFVLSISDGEIANWATERDAFKKTMGDQHYAHIQIGPETAFTGDLRSWGVPVYPVSGGDDLSKIMVNAAKSTYSRYVTQ